MDSLHSERLVELHPLHFRTLAAKMGQNVAKTSSSPCFLGWQEIKFAEGGWEEGSGVLPSLPFLPLSESD